MVIGKNCLKTLDLEHCAGKGRCAVFLPWKSWEKTWSAFLQSHHEGVVSLSGRLGLSWPISLLREDAHRIERTETAGFQGKKTLIPFLSSTASLRTKRATLT